LAGPMDAAEAFMQAAMQHPVDECLEPVARLDRAVNAASVDISFSERPHAGGEPRLYLPRASIVDDLLRIGEGLNRRGRRLVIEDGLRAPRMQRQLTQSPHVIERVADRTSWEVGGGIPPLVLSAPDDLRDLMKAALERCVAGPGRSTDLPARRGRFQVGVSAHPALFRNATPGQVLPPTGSVTT
jgi:hypothetical protein